jgi:hypothetical protein
MGTLKKGFTSIFIVLLALTVFLGAVRIAEATTITVTRTFTGQTYDGYLIGADTSYNSTWNKTSADSVHTSETYMEIGQVNTAGITYSIERSFVYFDTSALPDPSTITSASLSIYISENSTTNDFNITIQNGQPLWPHSPLEAGDYNRLYYGYYVEDEWGYLTWTETNGGSRNTTEITALDYWNITMNTSGKLWISKSGTTKLCLRSSKDISGISATSLVDEHVRIGTADYGEAYAPKLYVTYTTEGYMYIVHGPYYENGAVANCIANLTLQIENSATNYTVLNGTDGVADTVTFQIEQRGIAFTWNISSAGTNQTRTYSLTSSTFEELYIFLPNPDEPAYLYTFQLIDLAGISNGYLETIIPISGQNRIVERQKVVSGNDIPFWLIEFHSYDLVLICDKGTLDFGNFIPQATTALTRIVPADAFTPSWRGLNVTVAATRRNNTWVQVNYSDTTNSTSWVYVSITHSEYLTTITDYSLNGTNPMQLNWYNAISTTNYRVAVQALVNVTVEWWSFAVPAIPTATNPFSGVWDILGTFPFPAASLVGFFIIMCVLLLTSYVNMVFGCFLTLIVAVLLNWLTWMTLGWNLIAFGFAIVVLAAIREAKRGEAYEPQ